MGSTLYLYWFTVELYMAGIGLMKTIEQPHASRFPSPILANQSVYLTCEQTEIDAIENHVSAEVLCN
jgi:hypothetical protein